jgi:hypothetical protein
LQSRNRPAANIVWATKFRKRFLAVIAAFDRLFPPMRGKLRRPSRFHIPRLGALWPLAEMRA